MESAGGADNEALLRCLLVEVDDDDSDLGERVLLAPLLLQAAADRVLFRDMTPGSWMSYKTQQRRRVCNLISIVNQLWSDKTEFGLWTLDNIL